LRQPCPLWGGGACDSSVLPFIPDSWLYNSLATGAP